METIKNWLIDHAFPNPYNLSIVSIDASLSLNKNIKKMIASARFENITNWFFCGRYVVISYA